MCGWVQAVINSSLSEVGVSPAFKEVCFVPSQGGITGSNCTGQFSSYLQPSLLEKTIEELAGLQLQWALEELDCGTFFIQVSELGIELRSH